MGIEQIAKCSYGRIVGVTGKTIVYDMVGLWDNPTAKRLLAYAKHIQKAA